MKQKLPILFSARLPSTAVRNDKEVIYGEEWATSTSIVRATRAAGKATQGRYEKEVLRIRDWPEVKKTTVKKCTKILGKTVCINWPQLWKRTSRLSVFLVITFPKGFEKDVKACAALALTGAVMTLVSTGNLKAAAAAFEGLLKACLAKKASEAAGKCKVSFDSRKVPGKWKKV